MGRGNAVLGVFIFMFLVLPCSGYMIYKVGEDDGWTNRLKGSNLEDEYTKWASGKSFSVGDMLGVFEI